MGKYTGLTKNTKTNQKSKLPVMTSGTEVKPISGGRSILSTTAFRNAGHRNGFGFLFWTVLQFFTETASLIGEVHSSPP